MRLENQSHICLLITLSQNKALKLCLQMHTHVSAIHCATEH